MTDDASPENLRKFLESDDPAMRRMGLSMAKGAGVPEELRPLIVAFNEMMARLEENLQAQQRIQVDVVPVGQVPLV